MLTEFDKKIKPHLISDGVFYWAKVHVLSKRILQPPHKVMS